MALFLLVFFQSIADPAHVGLIIDRKGILRDVSFGQSGHVEAMIQKLLNEN